MQQNDPKLITAISDSLRNNSFNRIVEDAKKCGFCSQPIKVKVSHGDPDGGSERILMRCKSRREMLCPSCSSLYKGDARKLIVQGLTESDGGAGTRGGKLFFTLTAPSFGSVHSSSGCGSENDRTLRKPVRCRHGKWSICKTDHDENDDVIGQPLCYECYDYESAVLWNACAGELWRRTVISTKRHLTNQMSLRRRDANQVPIAYIKVAEFQKRNIAHFHGIFRSDTSSIAAADLERAFSQSIENTGFFYKGNSVQIIAWGREYLLSPIYLDDNDAGQQLKMVNYLAKYATKSSTNDGSLDRKIRSEYDLRHRNLDRHTYLMAAKCLELSNDSKFFDLKLQNHCQAFGFRGHFLTKTRNYSTTFAELRSQRFQWATEDVDDSELSEPPVYQVESIGWQSLNHKFIAEAEFKRHSLMRYEAHLAEEND